MVLDKICGDGEAFDYYDTGDSEAFRVDSPEGKRFIDDLMDDAKSRFMKNLKAVRGVLGFFSDEELYNTKMGALATMTLKLKNESDLARRLFLRFSLPLPVTLRGTRREAIR